ncbi:hypothetical protein B0T16DRAFT_444245 [Cercophora newfieldiana]|uniref:BTB domain-containing protein n=1 Tax=Cercophora newfieldiana TaxID=92897 RepID=A0AA39Y8L8_9PEZI|nr:hypothetical protein B0T16DRAFT_444245 [Cercophora newfieldiana]
MSSGNAPRFPSSISSETPRVSASAQSSSAHAPHIKQEAPSDSEEALPARNMPRTNNTAGPARGTTRAGRGASARGGSHGGNRGAAKAGGAGPPARASPVVDALTAANPPSPSKQAGQKRKRPADGASAAQPWSASVEVKHRFTNSDLELLQSGKFADASVICGNKTWPVHKTILCPRSKWFERALSNPDEGGQAGVVNLTRLSLDEVETILKFIYSGSLDMDKFGLEHGSFFKYASLFNLAQLFELQSLADDALSLLGQYCDMKLKSLCSLDADKTGRSATVGSASDPSQYLNDLLEAIRKAYLVDVSQDGTPLQQLLATFVYAGRNRLLQCAGFHQLSNDVQQFGNDIFKLMIGKPNDNSPNYAPASDAIHKVSTGLDHTHKSQHPDRCAHCNGLFDDKNSKKAMYNPFIAVVRPATYCAPCVTENANSPAPLWRLPPAPTKETTKEKEKEKEKVKGKE